MTDFKIETRPDRSELPAIDKEMLASLLDNFDKVMIEGPNPKKKDLLRRPVKKVLVHDRRTLEIWYALPNRRRFEHSNIWLRGRMAKGANVVVSGARRRPTRLWDGTWAVA